MPAANLRATNKTNVSPRALKKQLLVEFFAARGGRVLETRDLQAARELLHRQLGPADKTALSYIASTLRGAGYEVRYEDRYSDPFMPEPYGSRLKDVLEFRDFTSAEQSLLRLDSLYREYQAASDRVGANWVRAIAKKGKLRAQSLAANSRVQQSKRNEKREIARWFQVWLETPDLFADWLDLRKSSEEFRQTFGR